MQQGRRSATVLLYTDTAIRITLQRCVDKQQHIRRLWQTVNQPINAVQGSNVQQNTQTRTDLSKLLTLQKYETFPQLHTMT
jgi:hypothetical protein